MKKYILYLGIFVLFFSLFVNVKNVNADCCVTIDVFTRDSICETLNGSGQCDSGLPPAPGSSGMTCVEYQNYIGYNLCDNIPLNTTTCCIIGPGNCTTTTTGVCVEGDPQAGACPSSCIASNTSSSSTIEFENPIPFYTVSGLVSSILNNLMGIIAFIAAIFIVIGGIMYMVSGGDEEMIKKAKKTLTGAVAGLAIALATPTFLKEIQIILGGNSATGGSADNWVSNSLRISQIVTNVLNFLLSVIGILAIIALVIGGGMYLTAYGDEKRVDEGKKVIKYAIIGIAVALSALIIIRQVGNIFGATMG